MSNQYFETLSDVRLHLELKYNVNIENIPAISYEKSEQVKTDTFVAKIYRMPSGRYELVDYKL